MEHHYHSLEEASGVKEKCCKNQHPESCDASPYLLPTNMLTGATTDHQYHSLEQTSREEDSPTMEYSRRNDTQVKEENDGVTMPKVNCPTTPTIPVVTVTCDEEDNKAPEHSN